MVQFLFYHVQLGAPYINAEEHSLFQISHVHSLDLLLVAQFHQY